MSVSDRLVVLNDGQIEQIGTAEELYEEPVSRFVADFIGDVNTVRGTVRSVSDATTTIEVDGGEFVLESDAIVTDGRKPQTGDAVAVCVRAEHIRIDDSYDGQSFAIPGRVRNRIYKGDEVSYVLDTDVGTLLVNTDAAGFQIGDAVYATWDEEGTHVFASGAEDVVEASGAGRV